ncbi:MAG TPA: hypothetical protein VIB80_06005 [Aquiluna sp.]
MPTKTQLTIAIVLSLQALVLWALLGWSIYSVITGNSASFISAVGLTFTVFLATVWVSNIAYGVIRLRTSAHTPAMVIQLLIASIGAASFGGEFGSLLIGWLAILPSTIAFFLLLSKNGRALFGKN